MEVHGISCEVIDVQTLLPFDIHHKILDSIKKTNRVIFADEDVPGGATAFMMQQVLRGSVPINPLIRNLELLQPKNTGRLMDRMAIISPSQTQKMFLM